MKFCSVAVKLILIVISLIHFTMGQGNNDLNRSLAYIEKEVDGFEAKLLQAEKLLKEADTKSQPKDSVYARLLHRIGVWRYYARNDFQNAIRFTRESISINKSGKGSAAFTVNSYNNLGIFFADNYYHKEALNAFDSVILLSRRFPEMASFGLLARLSGAQVYSRLANYQQSIDEASWGISEMKEPDDWILTRLYIERAIAYAKFNKLALAATDIAMAEKLIGAAGAEEDVWADLYSTKALIYEIQKPDSAGVYYEKALKSRIRFGYEPAIAEEYSDIGIFYSKSLGKHAKALEYYSKGLTLASQYKLDAIQANIYLNIADANNKLNKYDDALSNVQKGLRIATQSALDNYDNPTADAITHGNNMYSQFVLLNNKGESFLLKAKQNSDSILFRQALKTFYLADLAVNQLRFQQQSVSARLFWSSRTRPFYTMAVEAAYLAGDAEALLYFMEKSRAVLLNDKLKELGALAYLPAKEAAAEQRLKWAVTTYEKQLEGIDGKSEDYQKVHLALLNAREELTHFSESLAATFPVYHQYRYNAAVPDVLTVRQQLLRPDQSFLSFFEADNFVYTLLITNKDTRFYQSSVPGYQDSLNTFFQLVSNQQLLNRDYKRYASVSEWLYERILAPVKIPKGRVIVSTDKHLIPLDALTKDKSGKQFLLYDNLFSYTYSAGYLLRLQHIQQQSRSGFLGVAPENFSYAASLNKLTGSVQSLENIAGSLSGARVLKYHDASRNYFLKHAGDYGLIHIYAHAQAKEDSEPQLYLSDSAISVSELRYWHQPNVALAFLAACETGIGELEAGEGINSLARSFAAVGVPATIATLWKAENQAMYTLSERFYQYLALGLPKDEALQKAKISLLESGDSKMKLPYYWASVILSGNAVPLHLDTQQSTYWYWVMAAVVLTIITLVLFVKKRDNRGF